MLLWVDGAGGGNGNYVYFMSLIAGGAGGLAVMEVVRAGVERSEGGNILARGMGKVVGEEEVKVAEVVEVKGRGNIEKPVTPRVPPGFETKPTSPPGIPPEKALLSAVLPPENPFSSLKVSVD